MSEIFNTKYSETKQTIPFKLEWLSDEHMCNTCHATSKTLPYIPKGEYRKTTAPDGRRVLFLGTALGNIVLFEKYKEGNVIIFNTSKEMREFLNGIVKVGAATDIDMRLLLGRTMVLPNMSQRIEILIKHLK